MQNSSNFLAVVTCDLFLLIIYKLKSKLLLYYYC